MRFLPVFLLVISCAGLVPVWAAEERCAETSIQIEKRTEDKGLVQLRFEVRLSSPQACAQVSYDVVLDQMLPNKQWKGVRLPQHVEVRGGSATQSVQHAMAKNLELLRYMTQVVSCDACAGADTSATPPESASPPPAPVAPPTSP